MSNSLVKTDPEETSLEKEEMESNACHIEFVKEDSEIILPVDVMDEHDLLVSIKSESEPKYDEEQSFHKDDLLNEESDDKMAEIYEVVIMDEHLDVPDDEGISYKLAGPPKVCSNCGQSWQPELAPHTCTNSDGLQYQCTICPEKFRFKQELQQHNKGHLSSFNFKLCTQCKKPCKNVYELMAHMRHHEVKPLPTFKCDRCEKSFVLQDLLNMHISIQHSSLPAVSFSPNLSVKTEEKFICDICENEFPTKSKLTEHLRRYRVQKKGFKCPRCRRFLKSLPSLRQHVNWHRTKNNQKVKEERK